MRGRYQYFRAGQPVPVEETFFKSSEGLQAVRSAPPYRIEVSAQASDGTQEAYSLSFSGPEGVIRLDAARSAQGLHAVRFYNGAEAGWQLPGDALFFPLLRVFAGRVIRQIVAQGGQAAVIVPDIRHPQDTPHVLTPLTETRRAQQVGQSSASWDGGNGAPCDVFSYVGGAYDDSARFYLQGDMLVRYTFEDWEIVLMDYMP